MIATLPGTIPSIPTPPQAIVSKVMRFATHDGPGIRTTIFFKGCPLDCWWCHNPESQSFQPQVVYSQERCRECYACVEACPSRAIEPVKGGVETSDACTRCGTCVPFCGSEARDVVGRRVTVPELLAEAERDLVFYEESHGGVTLSGGEPVSQPRFAAAFLAACRERGIHTAIETCGYAREEVFQRVARAADLVLFDLKIMDPDLHRRYTGVSNEPIHRNLEWLVEQRRPLTVRIPVVPGLNDSPAEIERFAAYLGRLRPERVELLGYHRIGTGKYDRLGFAYRLDDTPAASDGDLGRFLDSLERAGLSVWIGG